MLSPDSPYLLQYEVISRLWACFNMGVVVRRTFVAFAIIISHFSEQRNEMYLHDKR